MKMTTWKRLHPDFVPAACYACDARGPRAPDARGPWWADLDGPPFQAYYCPPCRAERPGNQLHAFTCPRCGTSDNVTEGYTGQPTCTRCHHEWEPATEAERERWELRCQFDAEPCFDIDDEGEIIE
jgi:hypothetical protein